MRRADREIKEFEEIVKVMERCEVCRLAFHDDDYPYILPLNFGMQVESGKVVLYFHGALEGKKYRLIEKDNRAGFEMDCSTRLALLLDKGNCTMEYESVIGQGLVEILPESEKEKALNLLMSHYRGEDFPYNKAVIPKTTVFKLTVESCTGKRRKLGSRTEGILRLVRPSMDYAEDIMNYREEFLACDPKEDMAGSGGLEDYTSAEEWIRKVESLRSRETCPANLVESDIYLAVRAADNKIVGIIELRRHINHPVLSLWGGQIGYCVRPNERKKGYASEMLRQVLAVCKAYGQDKILITCKESNLASERTILSGGGKYQQTVWSGELEANMKRFWISL